MQERIHGYNCYRSEVQTNIPPQYTKYESYQHFYKTTIIEDEFERDSEFDLQQEQEAAAIIKEELTKSKYLNDDELTNFTDLNYPEAKLLYIISEMNAGKLIDPREKIFLKKQLLMSKSQDDPIMKIYAQTVLISPFVASVDALIDSLIGLARPYINSPVTPPTLSAHHQQSSGSEANTQPNEDKHQQEELLSPGGTTTDGGAINISCEEASPPSAKNKMLTISRGYSRKEQRHMDLLLSSQEENLNTGASGVPNQTNCHQGGIMQGNNAEIAINNHFQFTLNESTSADQFSSSPSMLKAEVQMSLHMRRMLSDSSHKGHEIIEDGSKGGLSVKLKQIQGGLYSFGMHSGAEPNCSPKELKGSLEGCIGGQVIDFSSMESNDNGFTNITTTLGSSPEKNVLQMSDKGQESPGFIKNQQQSFKFTSFNTQGGSGE
ncbi:hypothetical protein FGO68_gene13569 [Halteria grandinella]|uniref:Uncharacterized protein n=1 Tax=Halteria grandinella TaxID=5974 RepID=A0A8J8NPY0_HALGN|nr:hypothetical protein FGO68_gene13569 [Halteria grandinella]